MSAAKPRKYEEKARLQKWPRRWTACVFYLRVAWKTPLLSSHLLVCLSPSRFACRRDRSGKNCATPHELNDTRACRPVSNLESDLNERWYIALPFRVGAGKLLLLHSLVTLEDRGKSGDKISKFSIFDFNIDSRILTILYTYKNSDKNGTCNSIRGELSNLWGRKTVMSV